MPQRAAADALARELNMPFEQVERVFNDELRRIEATVRIKTVVGVLVAGHVRAELRRPQRATELDLSFEQPASTPVGSLRESACAGRLQ